MTEIDKKFMELALEEAVKGKGFTKTNPLVGAVIVKNNKVVSKGYHRKFGGEHAEIDAIKQVSSSLEGSTLYVTLEPCSTTGKTPPCTEAIIKSGIKQVVIGAVDPNPLHSGRGIDILRERDIEVSIGVLGEESKKINKPFWTNILKKRPYVCLKMAMTLDGKTATATGDSKWITNDESRKLVHKLRGEFDAVMVGKNTALCDNPSLTVRDIESKRQPDRILVDSRLETPLSFNIFRRTENERIFCIISGDVSDNARAEYLNAGVILIETCNKKLTQPLNELLKQNISSVFLEGGSILAAAMLKEKLVDEIMFFYAPKILGSNGISCIGDLGMNKMSDAIQLKSFEPIKKIRGDFLIQAEVEYINNQ